MRPARNRPPKLEPGRGISQPAAAPTEAQLVERAKLAGAGASGGPGPTELRRHVERLVAGDRGALGELVPLAGVTVSDAWAVITKTFGATAESPVIDPACTVAGIRTAVARVREVAARGERVALACARPAALLTLHLSFARLAREHGGEVPDLDDCGPIRADGRSPRWLRWVGGVAVVTDGEALCGTREGEAAREWMFAIARPALVVADGPFAEVAWEHGIEVVTCAGLERPGLAVAATHLGRCTVVPLRTDRPARSYEVLERIVASGSPPDAPSGPPPDPSADGPALDPTVDPTVEM